MPLLFTHGHAQGTMSSTTDRLADACDRLSVRNNKESDPPLPQQGGIADLIPAPLVIVGSQPVVDLGGAASQPRTSPNTLEGDEDTTRILRDMLQQMQCLLDEADRLKNREDQSARRVEEAEEQVTVLKERLAKEAVAHGEHLASLEVEWAAKESAASESALTIHISKTIEEGLEAQAKISSLEVRGHRLHAVSIKEKAPIY